MRTTPHTASDDGALRGPPSTEARRLESGDTVDGGALRDDPREFERYALVAALTLLILSLLWIDRRAESRATERRPSADNLLRVEIGGTTPQENGHRAIRRDLGDREQSRRGGPSSESKENDRSPTREGGDDDRQARRDEPPAPPPPVVPEQRTYLVQDRDTLSAIAERELGTTRRAGELALLNGIEDPRKLRAGTTLKLPAR